MTENIKCHGDAQSGLAYPRREATTCSRGVLYRDPRAKLRTSAQNRARDPRTRLSFRGGPTHAPGPAASLAAQARAAFDTFSAEPAAARSKRWQQHLNCLCHHPLLTAAMEGSHFMNVCVSYCSELVLSRSLKPSIMILR